MNVGKSSDVNNHFCVDEFVVYPSHGVGRIQAIEEQDVAGFRLALYIICFEKDKMIVRVPVSKAEAVGMRKLSSPRVIDNALAVLQARAKIKRVMWSRRVQEYESKINSGDILAVASIVRDLYRSKTQPEQSYSERQIYEAARKRMAQEIAVIEETSEQESIDMIELRLSEAISSATKKLSWKSADELESSVSHARDETTCNPISPPDKTYSNGGITQAA